MSILIVEDEPALRESLVEGLAGAYSGIEIRSSASVEQALEAIDRDCPDLVITDIRLPGRDGIDLFVESRNRNPELRFVFMSAFGSASALAEAQRNGIAFLQKPFRFEDLLQAVEAALTACEFSGRVGGIALIDLLQILNLGRRSARVCVRGRGRSGEIVFRNGEVTHAQTDGNQGIEAFREMLSWPGGRFETTAPAPEEGNTISASFNSLLLDTLRLQDEDGIGEFQFDGEASFASDPVLHPLRVESADFETSKLSAPTETSAIDAETETKPAHLVKLRIDLSSRDFRELSADEHPLEHGEARGYAIAVHALMNLTSLHELDARLAARPEAALEPMKVVFTSVDSIGLIHRSRRLGSEAMVTIHPREFRTTLGSLLHRLRQIEAFDGGTGDE